MRSVLPEPLYRIDRLRVDAEFEVQGRRAVRSAADRAQGLAGLDASPLGHGERREVAVQRELAVAVVEDHELTVAREDVREGDPAAMHRGRPRVAGGGDLDPVLQGG